MLCSFLLIGSGPFFESPDRVYSGYQMKPVEEIQRPRDDIVAGTTCHTGLIACHLQPERESPSCWESINYVHSVGAEYVFLLYNHESVPQESLVNYRGRIEESLEGFLNTHKLGYVLGGASGTVSSYVDLLVVDTDAFNRLLGNVIADFDVEISCIPFRALKD